MKAQARGASCTLPSELILRALFILNISESPRDETEALAVGTVVGASLASCAVFVLACGFLIWYFARKRYER